MRHCYFLICVVFLCSLFVVGQSRSSQSPPTNSKKATPIFVRREFGPEDCADKLSPALAVLERIRQRRQEIMDSTARSSPADVAAALRVFESGAQDELPVAKLEQWLTWSHRCYGNALEKIHVSDQDAIDSPVRLMVLIGEERKLRSLFDVGQTWETSSATEDSRFAAEYNTLVEKYNALVHDYNSLLQSAKQYYVQDMQFHSLVQSYISRPVVVPTIPTLPPARQTIYCSSNSWPGGMTFTTCQ